MEANTKSFEGGILVHAEGGARGAPAIVLGKRVAAFFREARCGKDFAMVRLEMVPPVLLWSFHAPQHQLSNDTFESSILELQQAIFDLSKGQHHQMLQIGGGDLNTQVGPKKGLVGRFARVNGSLTKKELELSMAF